MVGSIAVRWVYDSPAVVTSGVSEGVDPWLLDQDEVEEGRVSV